jgi:hypothetical protein
LILLSRSTADADCPNHLPASFERNSTREDHDATLIRHMDPKNGPPDWDFAATFFVDKSNAREVNASFIETSIAHAGRDAPKD